MDAYLIKTDCNGNTDCKSSDVPFEEYKTVMTFFSNTINMLSASGSGNPTTLNTSSTINSTPVCIAAACIINSDFYASDTTICMGTTINFTSTSTGATAYKWYLNNTLIGQSATVSNIFNEEGDYKILLEASNSKCSDIDTLIISVKSNPKLVVSNDTTICNATSAKLLVGGATKYKWLNASGLSCSTCVTPIASPTSTQYYYVEGTSIDGCVSKDSIHVVVKCCVNGKVSPQAGFSFSDTTICVNDIVTITNLSYTSINNVNAEWDFSAAAIPQFSNAIQPSDVKFTKNGKWPIRLVTTDDCGKDTVINYINVFNPPVVNPYPDVNLCAQNDRVQFNITPISDYSYSWMPTTGLSNPTIANPVVNLVDRSIVYRLSIKDNVTGCVSFDSIKVSSHTSFQIQAMNDTTIRRGDNVTLEACCGNFTWIPSTYLINPSAKNPVARPDFTMLYYVNALDSIGCTAKDSVLITVIEQEPIIPNLITPNGDNLNDFFEVKYICSNSKVEIYNRWGDLVFKSDDYKNDWNASDVTDGMYYITFKSGCGGNLYKSWLQVVDKR